MMRRDTRYNVYVFICLAAILLSCSKVDKCSVPDSEFDLNLFAEVESIEATNHTKADLLNSGSSIPDNKFTLYAWEGADKWIDGKTAEYKSDKWTLPSSYSLNKDSDYSFLAYANMPTSGASISMPSAKTGDVKFSVSDISAAQKDVLIGKGSKTHPITDGNVDISFSHPYSSVKFKLGNVDGVAKVTGVSLTGVYETGFSTITSDETDYSWTVPEIAGATISVSGLNVTSGDITSFVVIPQTLSTKQAVITVTYVNSSSETKTMTKLLNTGSWTAGNTTVYTIDRVGSISATVSADGKTITNGASASKSYVRATITGAWYESDAAIAAIVAPWSISEGTWTGLFPSADWEAGSDGYYYLKNPLDASDSATTYTSYTKPSKPSGLGASAELRLNVLVQAIPYNVNKTCQEAFAAL